jgi:AcrR family transcriptional regulator
MHVFITYDLTRFGANFQINCAAIFLFACIRASLHESDPLQGLNMSLPNRRISEPPAAETIEAPGTTQKQRLSERTRRKLVGVTIRCLVRFGYARTTAIKVAAEAGFTRGAVAHHYGSILDLVRATIVELQEKRMRALGRVSGIGQDRVGDMMRTYWEQLKSDNSIAFDEVRFAARTDQDLQSVLNPLETEYQERWDSRATEIFSDWGVGSRPFRLAFLLSNSVMEGMEMRRRRGALNDEDAALVLEYLEQKLIELHPAAPPASAAGAPSSSGE